VRSKTHTQDHAISRSPLIQLVSGAGHLEILVLVLAVAGGLLAGILLDNFILGFLALAVVALLGLLLLSLVGPGAPRDGHSSPRESRERQRVPS
jgi:hypothetical protein